MTTRIGDITVSSAHHHDGDGLSVFVKRRSSYERVYISFLSVDNKLVPHPDSEVILKKFGVDPKPILLAALKEMCIVVEKYEQLRIENEERWKKLSQSEKDETVKRMRAFTEAHLYLDSRSAAPHKWRFVYDGPEDWWGRWERLI